MGTEIQPEGRVGPDENGDGESAERIERGAHRAWSMEQGAWSVEDRAWRIAGGMVRWS